LHFTDLREREFERILLIKPSAVGDVVHTLPVLAKLRQRYPSARIDWMLTPGIAELIRHHPALSGVVLFARDDYARSWRDLSGPLGFIKLLADLRAARYDLVIDLHGQFRSALFTLATRAKTRIGFDRPRRSLRRASRPMPREALLHGWTGAREGSWVAYTHRIRVRTLDAHAVDRYLWVGDMLGFADGPLEFSVPVPEEAEHGVDALLAENGVAHKPLALLTPGTIWETKHWLTESFAVVARHFLSKDWAVVLAGASRDVARCREVAAACEGVCDLSGRTKLSELAALIRRAAICVTNDSGPMHLAAAMNTPMISIFGPTDPLWIGPYGRPDAVVRAGVECSPCYLRKLRDCPHNHACMRQVTPQEVIGRVEQMLATAVKF